MTDTWNSRLPVAEALEAAGWIGDKDNPLEILRHPSGAVWAVINDCGDCGLDCPDGNGIDIPGGVPDTVVIAWCLAAASLETTSTAFVRHTCVSVRCNTCGSDLGLGDADEQAHFASEAEARSWVGHYDWTFDDEGRATCDADDCRTGGQS